MARNTRGVTTAGAIKAMSNLASSNANIPRSAIVASEATSLITIAVETRILLWTNLMSLAAELEFLRSVIKRLSPKCMPAHRLEFACLVKIDVVNDRDKISP